MKQNEIDQMNLLQRAAAPTPKFFRNLQIIGLTLIAACGGVLSGNVAQHQAGEVIGEAVQAIPPVVNSIAKYVGIAGALLTTISQFSVAARDESKSGKSTR